MSLLEQAKGRGQGSPCSVARILRELPPEEADALRTMLDAPWRVWGHQAIEDALRAEEHDIGTGQVGKHRRGTCRCDRSPK